jgi:hypothetical protein
MAKLSKRIVIQAETSEKDFIWDNEPPGFGLRAGDIAVHSSRQFSELLLAFAREGQSEHDFLTRQDVALFGRLDRQQITLKFEEPHLILRIENLIPGHINFGDPSAVFDGVFACVGGERLHKCYVVCVLRWWLSICC